MEDVFQAPLYRNLDRLPARLPGGGSEEAEYVCVAVNAWNASTALTAVEAVVGAFSAILNAGVVRLG